MSYNSPTRVILPPAPEEVGNESIILDDDGGSGSPLRSSDVASAGGGVDSLGATSVATLSSPWQYDDHHPVCQRCHVEFTPLNRRHHCRLCGKIFCHNCSAQKALIPPSSIVLVPCGGKKSKPRSLAGTIGEEGQGVTSFTPDQDPDRMLTYTSGGSSNELLYGKGLEERFKLAREPLRVCGPCCAQLAPLQEDLRASNSNAMRFNHVDPTDPRRLFNSPVAHTLGHEIRKAAYALNNLLPLPKRMGAMITTTSTSAPSIAAPSNNILAQSCSQEETIHCKTECSGLSPNLGALDGVRIPARLLEQARGIAVLTVLKGGFGLAGAEFGTGLVVARSAEDATKWSAPSAIGTCGVSWGALVGAQVADHVFLLMTDDAVQMLFADRGSVQLGADVGVALGPLGRAVEGNVGAAGGGGGSGGMGGPGPKVAPIYTYSLTKGLYAGVSLDGKVIGTRHAVNERFYGRRVSAREILAGAVPLPPAAQPLYEALARCHVYASAAQSASGGGSGMSLADEIRQRQRQQEQLRLLSSQQHVPSMQQAPAFGSYPQIIQPTSLGAPSPPVVAPMQPNMLPAATGFAPMAQQQQQQQQQPPQRQQLLDPTVILEEEEDEDAVLVGEYGEILNHNTTTLDNPLAAANAAPATALQPTIATVPPASGDAHSYAGMSDITMDPGY